MKDDVILVYIVDFISLFQDLVEEFQVCSHENEDQYEIEDMGFTSQVSLTRTDDPIVINLETPFEVEIHQEDEDTSGYVTYLKITDSKNNVLELIRDETFEIVFNETVIFAIEEELIDDDNTRVFINYRPVQIKIDGKLIGEISC